MFGELILEASADRNSGEPTDRLVNAARNIGQ
jgi:hypothetical protein